MVGPRNPTPLDNPSIFVWFCFWCLSQVKIATRLTRFQKNKLPLHS